MTDLDDLALARLSLAAYSDLPAGLPGGFAPLATGALPLADGTGSFTDGLFRNGNAAALVTTGLLDGQQTLVVAFRGSDDREDSINDLRDINADYPDFAGLVAAVDAYAAQAGFGQVAVTGHSLGGALAQLYMAEHPDLPGGVAHVADTFGSPGALLAPAPDARIENFVVGDDPAVFLGTHRAVVGEILRADPALAEAVAVRAAAALPGLTEADALESVPFLTTNYVNRGTIIVLPVASGGTDPGDVLGGLAQANPARHAPTLYVAEVAGAAGAPDQAVVVPDVAASAADLFYRALYAGSLPTQRDAEALVPQLLRDWPAGDGLDVLPAVLGQEWDALRADAEATVARFTHSWPF